MVRAAAVEVSRRVAFARSTDFCHDFSQSFRNRLSRGAVEGYEGGAPLSPSTPVCCCGAAVADRRRVAAALSLLARGRRGPKAPPAATSAEIAVLPSPIAPWKGAPLRVIFAAEKPLEGELSLIAPDGSVAARSRERHGGPPYFWFAEVKSPAAGTWRATLTRRAPAAARSPARSPCAPTRRRGPAGGGQRLAAAQHLESRRRKTCSRPGSRSCSTIRSTRRCRGRRCTSCCATGRATILFNHLGLGEDEMKMVLRPDCADLPYFLRAYFAFKMGLPFGYSKCTRGGGGRAPPCPQWFNIQNAEPPPPRPTGRRAGAPPGSPTPRGSAGRTAAPPSRRQRRRRRAARARGVVRRIHAGDRRQRPFRLGAHGARPTTTPTIIRCRSARRRCAPAPSTPIRTGTS